MSRFIDWQKIKEWIIDKYKESPSSEVTELIWLKRRIVQNQKINWSFVDTVEYNIDSIPKRREVIFEVKPKKIGTARGLLKNG